MILASRKKKKQVNESLEFEVSLVYTVSSRPVSVMARERWLSRLRELSALPEDLESSILSTHDGPQPFVTPISEDPSPSSGL